jgi:hypothetical protein
LKKPKLFPTRILPRWRDINLRLLSVYRAIFGTRRL